MKIWFTDFWDNFDKYDNYFTTTLGKYFDIEINSTPDILIHSVYGKNYLKYNCVRICYTAENTRPNFVKSDFHIGFDYCNNPRYLRWPLFLLYCKPQALLKPKNINHIVNEKKRFCAFVVSNEHSKERNDFFHELSMYKKVASGGKFLNNLGYCVEDKISFLKTCKFTIAYENTAHPGYTTEKIIESFKANSIPVYWGNEKIANDFNPKAFINAHDFKTRKDLVAYIKKIDQDDISYIKMLEEPCFLNNSVPEHLHEDRFISFFENIFRQIDQTRPIAKSFDYFEYVIFKIQMTKYKITKRIKTFLTN